MILTFKNCDKLFLRGFIVIIVVSVLGTKVHRFLVVCINSFFFSISSVTLSVQCSILQAFQECVIADVYTSKHTFSSNQKNVLKVSYICKGIYNWPTA